MFLPEERQSRRLEIRPSMLARLTVALCLCGAIAGSSQAAEGVCAASAKPANFHLALKDIQGKSVNLSDYRGKVILLDFWATWCPPCRKEIPGFIELYNTYKSRGLVVIGVSMDDADDVADVKR